MRLCIADIRGLLPRHSGMVAPERLEKAARYRMKPDRDRCIAAGVLLRLALGDAPLRAGKYGKPETENGLCFNLSHSGDYVILAVDDADVGCDIEQLRQINALRLGRHVFCERELELLKNSTDRLGCYFRFWTKKEALLKCMGLGFHRDGRTVDVSRDIFREDGDLYAMKTLCFSDYTISVCSKNKPADAELEFIDLDKI